MINTKYVEMFKENNEMFFFFIICPNKKYFSKFGSWKRWGRLILGVVLYSDQYSKYLTALKTPLLLKSV